MNLYQLLYIWESLRKYERSNRLTLTVFLLIMKQTVSPTGEEQDTAALVRLDDRAPGRLGDPPDRRVWEAFGRGQGRGALLLLLIII